jgi:hypothetical protein
MMTMANGQCSDELVSETVEAANKYRNSPDECKGMPVWAKKLSRVGTKPEHKGAIELPLNDRSGKIGNRNSQEICQRNLQGI